MSIFEPTPRESHWDDDEEEDDEEDDFPPAGPARSIRIAGVVVSVLVLLGLIVSNTAQREPAPRPLVPSVQVDPGAAAVEQAEATQVVRRPTDAPTTTPALPDDVDDDSRIEPVDAGWQVPDDRDRQRGPSKKDDRPGHGTGRGRN